jgi:hypothetical protein
MAAINTYCWEEGGDIVLQVEGSRFYNGTAEAMGNLYERACSAEVDPASPGLIRGLLGAEEPESITELEEQYGDLVSRTVQDTDKLVQHTNNPDTASVEALGNYGKSVVANLDQQKETNVLGEHDADTELYPQANEVFVDVNETLVD